MRRQSLAATVVLVTLVVAPLAFAQTTKPKKKGAKPADTASASATADTPPPDPAPPPPPADSAAAGTEAAAPKDLPATPPDKVWDSSDTSEDPTKTYYFAGLRYRGTIIPKFMVNLFVNDGATFYSNQVGAELDIRKDNHSTIPWVSVMGFNFGDTLFLEKGKPDLPYNYSDVSSGLTGLFFGLDELWSVPIDTSHHWDFEYGFGVGLGIIFGTLHNDWVYQTSDSSGPLVDDQGRHYSMCTTTAVPAQYAGITGNDCSAAGHSNSQNNKVNHYSEPNWFGGGSVPVIFPQVTFPNLGLRYKPVKEFEARLGVGFSLTGFWFGISGNYGFEKPTADSGTPAPKKDAERTGHHGML
jgi:hypothetical protein